MPLRGTRGPLSKILRRMILRRMIGCGLVLGDLGGDFKEKQFCTELYTLRKWG